MASNLIGLFQGDGFEGTFQLRLVDPNGNVNAYPIVTGSLIEIHWPAPVGFPVILSTVNSGEITITNAAASTINYVGAGSKSSLMQIGAKQAVDCIVTPPGGQPLTFEAVKIVTVQARANP